MKTNIDIIVKHNKIHSLLLATYRKAETTVQEIREKDLEQVKKKKKLRGKGWQDFQSYLEFKGLGYL